MKINGRYDPFVNFFYVTNRNDNRQQNHCKHCNFIHATEIVYNQIVMIIF